MANTTIVYFDEIWNYDKTTRIFRTVAPKRDILLVSSFEDGIAMVKPMRGCNITAFAKTVAGCFADESNFRHEVFKAFECEENATFSGIKFEFNGVTFVVTKENADEHKIYEEWDAKTQECR